MLTKNTEYLLPVKNLLNVLSLITYLKRKHNLLPFTFYLLPSSEAIVYLNILIRESVKEEVIKFKTQLEKLEQLAISLLQKDEGVQLSLFDDESFTTYNRQPRAFKSFLDWLDNLKYRFSGHTSVGERIGFKPLKVEQVFIRFGVS